MIQGILSSKNGMNLFRSCKHGCIYCDSKSKCYYDQMLYSYNIRLEDYINKDKKID